ncbi:PDZ domain-containing protein [Candidatus Pacearchaeota archaeon]|nr:PDZ domain-containing protein [Candidatus Pacearchaeota archaeon]
MGYKCFNVEMVYGGQENIMKLSLRIWILIIALILSMLAIQPSFKSGVIIKSIDKESPAFEEGLRSGETILAINGEKVEKLSDYTRIISNMLPSEEQKKISITTNSKEYIFYTNNTLSITVQDLPKSNIRMGLDLQGGARALIQPNATLTDAQLEDLIEISNNRFNAYGISDVQIKGVTDLEGNKFMLIEVAGATPQDLEELISQQGKFEAKIGNISVFEGGKRDISSVCRNDASCAGVTECAPSQQGYFCNFQFTIYLAESAAKRHADITRNISLDPTNPGYLSENLFLYVDDKEVDSLRVSSGLRGQETTQISIQGSGAGQNQDEALKEARASMKKLQTILITGSLPYKLEIVKLDTISPTLGNEFIFLIFFAGISSIVVVSIIIFMRYRKIKVALALLFTSFSELIIILGVAAFIKWNLDLPSIAGILATIGTGVDSQIMIIDETERGKTFSIRERIRRALFVIFSAYAASLSSLIPLYWAGAGLFQGFAITTIVGITAGVFISRPAFADMIKKSEE